VRKWVAPRPVALERRGKENASSLAAFTLSRAHDAAYEAGNEIVSNLRHCEHGHTHVDQLIVAVRSRGDLVTARSKYDGGSVRAHNARSANLKLGARL